MDQYKELCEVWRLKFLEMDCRAIIKKLPFLHLANEYLELNYLGQPHRICLNDGKIYNCITGQRLESFHDLMAIYHLFYYSCETPLVSGVWVPFREVKMASVFDQAFHNMVLKPFAENFAGKLEVLKQVIESLGYKKERYGDVSCKIPVFDKVELIMIFWDKDDEYPAQANILFDKTITDFTHPETVVILAQAAISQMLLKKEELLNEI